MKADKAFVYEYQMDVMNYKKPDIYAVIWMGCACNGKTTFIDAVQHLLAEKGVKTNVLSDYEIALAFLFDRFLTKSEVVSLLTGIRREERESVSEELPFLFGPERYPVFKYSPPDIIRVVESAVARVMLSGENINFEERRVELFAAVRGFLAHAMSKPPVDPEIRCTHYEVMTAANWSLPAFRQSFALRENSADLLMERLGLNGALEHALIVTVQSTDEDRRIRSLHRRRQTNPFMKELDPEGEVPEYNMESVITSGRYLSVMNTGNQGIDEAAVHEVTSFIERNLNPAEEGREGKCSPIL